jgi:hypothetical protein
MDRLIAPSAHHLASSGIGSARWQFRCSPCLANLYAELPTCRYYKTAEILEKLPRIV